MIDFSTTVSGDPLASSSISKMIVHAVSELVLMSFLDETNAGQLLLSGSLSGPSEQSAPTSASVSIVTSSGAGDTATATSAVSERPRAAGAGVSIEEKEVVGRRCVGLWMFEMDGLKWVHRSFEMDGASGCVHATRHDYTQREVTPRI